MAPVRPVVASIVTTLTPDPYWNGRIDLLSCGHLTYSAGTDDSHACLYCRQGKEPHVSEEASGRHLLPTGWLCFLASAVSDDELRRHGFDPARVKYENAHRAEVLACASARERDLGVTGECG
jgi:hypothetical protein